MWGSGMNLITTIIGFGMSATFIVFICIRIICRRLQVVESRPMLEIESGIDIEQPQQRVNGLEAVVVAAIPTMRFNHEAFKSVEDAQCSICLAEYKDKEELRIMPKCGHNFHLLCIDVWLRKQSTCPVCRLPLQESLERKGARQATVSMARAVDNPETSIDHSRRWLLPGAERSNNQGNLDTVPRTPEQISEESETMH